MNASGTTASFPSAYILRACVRVIRLIGEVAVTQEQLEKSYLTVASGGTFTSDAFREALAVLTAHGLIQLDGDGRVVRANLPDNVSFADEEQGSKLLAQWILSEHPPLWLRNAILDGGELSYELMPSEVEDRLRLIFPDVAERESMLLAAATRYNDALLRAAGALGEECVVSECKRWLLSHSRPDLASKVQQVSLISDHLGYDVSSPDLTGTVHQLEVKAYAGPALRFYLTRKEFEVGLQFLTWSLVFVKVDLRSQEGKVVGWCPADSIRDRVPADRDSKVSWESARLRLAETEILRGLPIQIGRSAN